MPRSSRIAAHKPRLIPPETKHACELRLQPQDLQGPRHPLLLGSWYVSAQVSLSRQLVLAYSSCRLADRVREERVVGGEMEDCVQIGQRVGGRVRCQNGFVLGKPRLGDVRRVIPWVRESSPSSQGQG